MKKICIISEDQNDFLLLFARLSALIEDGTAVEMVKSVSEAEDILKDTGGFMVAGVTKSDVASENTFEFAGRARADIRRCKQYIKRHLAEPLTLKVLSAYLCISPNYLCTTFRQNTGMSLKQYILHERMEWASYLLLSEDSPIHDIALRVGYANASYFARVFKKKYKMSPREWRDRKL